MFLYFFAVMSCLRDSQIKVTVASLRSIAEWRHWQYLGTHAINVHTLCANALQRAFLLLRRRCFRFFWQVIEWEASSVEISF